MPPRPLFPLPCRPAPRALHFLALPSAFCPPLVAAGGEATKFKFDQLRGAAVPRGGRPLSAASLKKFQDVVEQVAALALDRTDVFAEPVPFYVDYFSIVRKPMDFATLRRNLLAVPAGAQGAALSSSAAASSSSCLVSAFASASAAASSATATAYTSLQEAYEDLQRIFLNCMHFNQEVTPREGSLAQLAAGLLGQAREAVQRSFR